MLGQTVGKQVGVDEGVVVIGVEAEQEEGHAGPDDGESLEDPPLAAVGDGLCLKPSGGVVNDRQGMDVLPAEALAATGDEGHFGKTGAALIPLGEGADGDVRFEQTPRPGGGDAPGLRGTTVGSQLAIDGRRAHPEQRVLDPGRQAECAAPLQGLQQRPEEGAQALAAQTAGGLPKSPEGVDDYGVIADPRPAMRPRRRRPVAQEADGVLAVVPSSLGEGVQDLGLLGSRRRPVVEMEGLEELALGKGRHRSDRTSEPGGELGQIFDEATNPPTVRFPLSQCGKLTPVQPDPYN